MNITFHHILFGIFSGHCGSFVMEAYPDVNIACILQVRLPKKTGSSPI